MKWVKWNLLHTNLNRHWQGMDLQEILGDLWSGKPWKNQGNNSVLSKTLENQRILSICIGSKGVIAWCHALEIIALDQSHAVLWWIQNATWNGLCKPKETLKDLHYTKILVVLIDGPKVSLTIELNMKWLKI